MNKKNIFVGLIFILLSVWFYTALSSFNTVPDSFPQKLVVREGIERSAKEVAKKLADDMGFDLDGSYKSGYTPDDVVEYLISQPHTFNISFYKGAYYDGRITISRYIPFSICIILFLIGSAIIIFKSRN